MDTRLDFYGLAVRAFFRAVELQKRPVELKLACGFSAPNLFLSQMAGSSR
jgi:hypothetical protein